MPVPRLRGSVDATERLAVPGRAHHLLPAVVLALALALLVAGCGGADQGKDSGSGKDSPSSKGVDSPGDDEPAPDPGYQQAKVGACYQLTPAQSRASVVDRPAVPCRGQHNTVVAYVGYAARPITAATPLGQRRALARKLCEPAYRRVVGGTLADRATSILTWTMFTPGQAQLERGARWVRCDVLARTGKGLMPLPVGQPLLKAGVPEQLRVCQNNDGVDISCSRPHAFRVEAVFRAVGNAYPAAPGFTPTARQRCKELTGKDGGFWQPPSRAGWQAGDRFVRCLGPTLATAPS
jgi:hypothetical protein